jgi:CBS domain-containing protein
MTVSAILNEKGRDVMTTAAALSVAAAAEVMAELNIGSLVVVDADGAFSGIVSERDIVRAIARLGAAALAQDVGAVMTRNVITCGENDSINDVMERMTHSRFRHLPVAVDGRLAGIVSIGDVVKARIEQVEREAEEMRAYIATA